MNVGWSRRACGRAIALSSLMTSLATGTVASPDTAISDRKGRSATSPNATPTATGTSTPTGASATASEEAEDPKRAQARAYAMAAFSALDNGAYKDAITYFSNAIELLDVPTLRVGRADAFAQVGKWLEAKADYAAALGYSIQPEDSVAFAQSQTTAKLKLQNLELRIPELRVRTTADYVDVTVDKPPAVRLLRGEPLTVNPGSHRVLVTSSGRSIVHTIEVGDGQVITVDGPMPIPKGEPTIVTSPMSPPTPVSASRTDTQSSTEFVVSASLTGAFAVSTVLVGLVFFEMKSDYDKIKEYDPSDPLAKTGADESYERSGTVRSVLGGLAAATVVAAGVTTYFWVAPRVGSDTAAQANSRRDAAALTVAGVWLGAAGHF